MMLHGRCQPGFRYLAHRKMGRLLFLGLALELIGHLPHASYGYHCFCCQELKRRDTQVVRQSFRRPDELVDGLPYPTGTNPDELVNYVTIAHSASNPAVNARSCSLPASSSARASNTSSGVFRSSKTARRQYLRDVLRQRQLQPGGLVSLWHAPSLGTRSRCALVTEADTPACVVTHWRVVGSSAASTVVLTTIGV